MIELVQVVPPRTIISMGAIKQAYFKRRNQIRFVPRSSTSFFELLYLMRTFG